MSTIVSPRKEPKTKFTSRYVGVMWHSTKKQWRSAINILGNKRILGYFDSEIEAARAYNVMAQKYGKPYNVLPEEN
jgi:hypothetical protein